MGNTQTAKGKLISGIRDDAASQSSHLQVEVEGSRFQIRSGKNNVFWDHYSSGAWEPDTRAIFSRFIDAQHSYIDIGAWIGPTLLLGCPLAKRAYGIEPDPIAYSELVENIDSNRPITSNVQLFNICIAAESGKKAFGNRGDGGDSMSSLLFSDEKTNWTVDGMTFGEWIDQNGIDDCNFIKIDIEGGEYTVLPTMAAYITKHRPTLHLSLHPFCLGGRSVRSVAAKIKRSAYRLKCTVGIISVIGTYRYVYDPRGKVPSGIRTFRSRIRDFLAKVSWKPAVLLLTCLYSMGGGDDTLVVTDQRW